MRLRTRLALMVFVLFIASLWGLAARVAAVVQADLGNALTEPMSAMVRYVAADFDTEMQLRLDVLNDVAGSIAPARLGDAASVRQVLQRRTVSKALFPLGLIATDRDGRHIAEHPSTAGSLGNSIGDTDFFRQLMAGAKQAVSTQSAERGAGQPLFRIGVPLRDASGAAAGVLFGAVIAAHANVFGHLDETRIGKKGFISVVSPKDHLIVASTDRERSMQRLPAKGVNPLLDRRLEEGYEGPGVTTTSFGLEIWSVARRAEATGWMVLAAEPTAEIFAPIDALKRHIYLAALLISLAAAALLGWVLTRQLAPLRIATDAMRRMTAGEESLATIEIVRRDEIGELIGSFNQLVVERMRLEAALQGEVGAHKRAKDALDQALTRLQTLSEHMTRAQEEQRRKIAFELHEQAGQELGTLMLHLQILAPHCSGKEAQAQLQHVRTIAGLALQRVRSMSLDLHPPQLNEFGLYAALRGHCAQQAEAAGWIMHFDAPEEDDRPHRDVEIACFRVVQEALTNVAQHARASEVWVSLQTTGEDLLLSVRDNGIGFDPGSIGAGGGHAGLGLTAMAERVRQVAGRMEVKASPGSGTEIQVRFFSQFRLF